MKYNKGNKPVTQSLSNGAHSLMKDVKQEKETAVATKKTKWKLTNEQWPYEKSNGTLKTRRRVIKKPSRYNN